MYTAHGTKITLVNGKHTAIGRNHQSSIEFKENTISRNHAIISLRRNKKNKNYKIYIKDTSTNGTLLNNKKLSPNVWTEIKVTDVICLAFELKCFFLPTQVAL